MARFLHSAAVRTCILPRLLPRVDFSTIVQNPSASYLRGTTAPSSSVASDGLAETVIAHPWPEWADLLEMLLKKGYFDAHPLQPRPSPSSSKTFNRIRSACIGFARDRPDIFQYLSMKDIMVIVRCGCPSVDRKVINSAKRLRAFLGVKEANVCKSCELRGRCERAFAKSCENDDGSTVDVVRILLSFGLNLMTDSIDNKLFLKESVKLSARKLLSLVLEFNAKECESEQQEVTPAGLTTELLTSKQLQNNSANMLSNGDWACGKCNFLNFSKNLRCLRCKEISQEKLKKLKADRDHLPLKRGDWICTMCDFLNFAKNVTCLQCNEKPKDRQLNSGEWECTSCNFINFKRNDLCLKCGWKRPKAAHSEVSYFHSQQPDLNKSLKKSTTVSDNNFNRQSLWQNHTHHVDKQFWSSEDDESNSVQEHYIDTLIDFEDFPVSGGKSAISCDPIENQKWRNKKKDKSKGKTSKNNSEGAFQSQISSGHKASSFVDIHHQESDKDSDDEMSGWFWPSQYKV